MASKPTRALELKAVNAGYDGHDVIKNVSFDIDAGEFLGIIGPNGGGKTTLLKIILGLLKPRNGEVRIFGERPSRAHHLTGYVPQHSIFDREFPISVHQVVLMGRLGQRRFQPFYSTDDRALTREALEQVDMWEYRKAHIARLSGGQQQRVFIARALVKRPSLLLLDEPTASIDPKFQNGIYELLKELNQEMTIVLVTHDIGILASYVKKVACINRHFIYHGSHELTHEMLEAAYECPVDLITHAHGLPHRILEHRMPEGE